METDPRPETDDAAPAHVAGLSVREHMALQVEAMQWTYPGTREEYIRTHLGWSPVRQAQVVLSLIDRLDAIEAYPSLCARLRRLRDLRRIERTSPGSVGR